MKHYALIFILLALMGCARSGISADGRTMWFNGYGKAKFNEHKEIESRSLIELPRVDIRQ